MPVESSVTKRLVGRIAEFRDSVLPAPVEHRTALCLLDSLSCFSAGLSLEHFGPSAKVAQALFPLLRDDAATAARTSPFAVAYLYGQAANSLDYDDTLLGHPGAPIIGAVVAVAASKSLTTKRLLCGIAAGYEAHFLLSSAANPSLERAALVRSVGAWDTVAAAIGCAVALDFNDAMIERVLGVAVAHSLLPYTGKWYERPVPAMKNNLGWVAAGAVLATELAAAGQTGVTNALEGETGMWRMAGSDRWDFQESRAEKPAVMRVGFKQFPVCWHMQQYLSAMATLLASVDSNDEIVDIRLSGPDDVKKFCNSELLGSADIAFSYPAAFSLLISKVPPGPIWDSIDPNSKSLRHKQLFRYHRADERAIFLRTHKGREFSVEVGLSDMFDLAPSGLDEQGVLGKHLRLTDAALRVEAAAALEAKNAAPYGFYEALEGLITR